jgi:membrane-associated phospholipid phosphatase
MSQWYQMVRDWESTGIVQFQTHIPTQVALPYIYFSKKITKTNRYYVYLLGLLYQNPKIFSETVLVFYLCRTVTNCIKMYLKQPRPYNSYTNIRYLTKHKTSYSFPSQSMMSAVIVYHAYQRVGLGWISNYYFGSIILLLAITRIYRGLHYPHDMVVSLVLGYLIEVAVLYWLSVMYQ